MALGRETEISGYLAVGIPGVDQEVLRQVDLLPADVLCQSDFLTLVEQSAISCMLIRPCR